MNAVFPKITYNNVNLDSIKFNVGNDAERLNYKLLINSVQNPSIALFNAEISGAAADNQLDLNIFLRDQQLKDKYVIAGVFQSINQNFRFNLAPEKLLLGYD